MENDNHQVIDYHLQRYRSWRLGRLTTEVGMWSNTSSDQEAMAAFLTRHAPIGALAVAAFEDVNRFKHPLTRRQDVQNELSDPVPSLKPGVQES